MTGDPGLAADVVRDFARRLAEAGPDESRLAAVAAETCRKLLMARQCSIWLLPREGGDLVLQAAVGFDHLEPTTIGRLSYPLERPPGEPLGITPWILVHQEAVVADTYQSLRSHPAYRGEFERQLHGAGSDVPAVAHPRQQFCGVPISLGSTRLGVLKVENKTVLDEHGERCFSRADQALLDTLTSVLALALAAAREREQSDLRAERLRRATLRSMRGEAMEFEQAQAALASAGGDAPGSPVADAFRLLSVGIAGVRFWLDNLERLLAATVDVGALMPLDVAEMVRHEVLLFRRTAGHRLEAHLVEFPAVDSGAWMRGDLLFIAAAVKVLLRHAYCEVARRQEREALAGQAPRRGRVDVACRLVDIAGPAGGPHLCVCVADDGEAASHQGARTRLAHAWAAATTGGHRLDARHAGLEFLNWVAEAHAGRAEARIGEGKTEFQLHLPLAQTGADPKEANDG